LANRKEHDYKPFSGHEIRSLLAPNLKFEVGPKDAAAGSQNFSSLALPSDQA
jgi:hypothetical protein